MKYKKVIIAICIIFVLLLVYYILPIRKKANQIDNSPRVYETMVVLRSQESADPEDDRKNSLKRGDVVAVRPEDMSGHRQNGTAIYW